MRRRLLVRASCSALLSKLLLQTDISLLTLVFTRENSYCFQHILAIAILSVHQTGGSVINGAS